MDTFYITNLRNALSGRDLPAAPGQQSANRSLPRVGGVRHAQGRRSKGMYALFVCMRMVFCMNKCMCMYIYCVLTACMYE